MSVLDKTYTRLSDREHQAFIENSTDQGVDKRVHDIDGNTKLTGIGGILHGVLYDSVGVAYPSTVSEVYSFYTGGLAGSLVATVTLIYSNSSKTDLVSAVKT